MDQVKDALAVAMKYGFWIGSSIVLIGVLAIWYLATSELSDQTSSANGKIRNDVQKVRQYRGEMSDQPNEFSHKKMQAMIDAREGDVLKAWETVFDAQRDILTWPEKMQDEFLLEFKYAKDPETGEVDTSTLKLPFEKYEQFGVDDGDNVNPELLRRYERYIGEVLPSYAAIAGCDWTAEFSRNTARSMGGGMDMMSMMMGAGGGMMRGGEVDKFTGQIREPLVRWSSGSQDAVLGDLFPWRNRKEYPSELDVYYSQENLWILRQLLQIVAAVNGDAKQAFEAKIREIKKLSIGKSVSFDNGSISDPGSRVRAGFGGGYEDMMGEMEGMDMDMDYESMGMGGAGGTETIETDPGDGRYVNTAFEPIDASTLRSAFSSEDPNQVAIAVAKRVPVMMQLTMDQREVPTLLAICGSAPLMVDVHQVRIMPPGGSSAMGGMGGMDMMMGDMEDDMMMGGMGMDMGMGMGGGMATPMGPANEDFPLDMDVEIYGLIYFYNPPNRETLGVEKITDDISIDESVDALPTPTTPEPAAPNVDPNAADPNAAAPADPNAAAPADPNAAAPADPNAAAPADPNAAAPADPNAAAPADPNAAAPADPNAAAPADPNAAAPADPTAPDAGGNAAAPNPPTAIATPAIAQ